jgi:hypothetical protein
MIWPAIVARIGHSTCEAHAAHGRETETSPAYRQLRRAIDVISAIDTHNDLPPTHRPA